MSSTNETLDRLLEEALRAERRNLSEARDLTQALLARTQQENYPSGQVYALRLLAAIELQQGKMEEGAKLLEEGLALARTLGEPGPLSACLHTQGWLFYAQGQLVQAIGNYYEALKLRLQPGQEESRANTCLNLGITYRELGDYEQALAYQAQARACYRELGKVVLEGNCLNNLGTLEGDRKSYGSALRYYQEAQECALSSQDKTLEVVTCYNIAHVYILMDRPHEAIPIARQARRAARALGNPGQKCSARLLDGMLHCSLRRFPRAERSLRAALEQSRQLKDNHWEIRALNELSNLYLRWSRPNEARGYLEQAMALATRMGADLQRATCHEYLVEVFEQLGDFQQALFHHKEFYRLERARFDNAVERQRLALRMSLDLERAEREAELQQRRNAELEERARRDSMTGLYNHQAFQELLRERLSRQVPLALLLLDVDHFKSYNDTFGHPAGDEVLRRLAQLLQTHFSSEDDVVARYGGEEFAVVITGAQVARAHQRADQVGQLIRETAFPHRRVTLSVGLAFATTQTTPSHLIAEADRALYRAKSSGRDRWAKVA